MWKKEEEKIICENYGGGRYKEGGKGGKKFILKRVWTKIYLKGGGWWMEELYFFFLWGTVLVFLKGGLTII